MSKLAEFLKGKKIDPRRVTAASGRVEALRKEDRAIRLAKRRIRSGMDDDATKALAAKKPRSGRKVAMPSLKAALEGRPMSGPTKTRILRAVNEILSQSKKQPVSIRELF